MRLSQCLRQTLSKLTVPVDYNERHPIYQCLVASRFAYRYRHKELQGDDVFPSDFNRATEAAASSVNRVYSILKVRKDDENYRERDPAVPRMFSVAARDGNGSAQDVWSRVQLQYAGNAGGVHCDLYRQPNQGLVAKDVHAACVALHTAGLFTVCPELVEPLIDVVVEGITRTLGSVQTAHAGGGVLFQQAAVHWSYAVKEWELLAHSEALKSVLTMREKNALAGGGKMKEANAQRHVSLFSGAVIPNARRSSDGSDAILDIGFQPALLAVIGLQLALFCPYGSTKTRIYSLSTVLRHLVVPALSRFERLANDREHIANQQSRDLCSAAQRELARCSTEALRFVGIPIDLSQCASLSRSEARKINTYFTFGNALMIHHALTHDESVKAFNAAYFRRDLPFPFDVPRISLFLSECLWKSFRYVHHCTVPADRAKVPDDDVLIRSERLATAGSYCATRSRLRPTFGMYEPWLVTCVPENCRSVCCGRLEYLHMLPPASLLWCPRAVCGFIMRSMMFQVKFQNTLATHIPILRGIAMFVQNVLATAAGGGSTASVGQQVPLIGERDSLCEVLRLVAVLNCCVQSISFTISCVYSAIDRASFLHRSTATHEMNELVHALRSVQLMLLPAGSEACEVNLHPFFTVQMPRLEQPTSVPGGFKPAAILEQTNLVQ